MVFSMGSLSVEAWTAILLVIMLGVALMLHALASGLRDSQRAIELKNECDRLRADYARRQRRARGEEDGEVEIVDEPSPAG